MLKVNASLKVDTDKKFILEENKKGNLKRLPFLSVQNQPEFELFIEGFRNNLQLLLRSVSWGNFYFSNRLNLIYNLKNNY